MEEPVLKEILRAYSCEATKGTISRLYKGFLTKKSYSTDYIKNKWEKGGDLEITKEERQNYCEIQWKCTNPHTEGICLKMFNKVFYYTKIKNLTIQEKTAYVGEAVGIRTQTICIYFGNAQG